AGWATCRRRDEGGTHAAPPSDLSGRRDDRWDRPPETLLADTETGRWVRCGTGLEVVQGEPGRADPAGIGSKLGGDDRGRAAVGGREHVLFKRLPGRVQQQVTDGRQAAAHHHEVEVEHVDQVGDADAEPPAHTPDQLSRDRVARERGLVYG